MKISIRKNPISVRTAAIFPSSQNVGVTKSALSFWKKQFASDPKMIAGSYEDIAEIIGTEYIHATPVYRFILRSGEIAEIRKAKWFYFVAAIRSDDRHDVIVIQPAYKPVSERTRQKRLTNEWVSKTRGKK